MGSGTVRVIVADDHPVYRQGLVRALRDDPEIEVLGDFPDGQQALSAIREHRPEVAMLDFRMPFDGLHVTKAIAEEGLPTRVLLISAFTESEFVSTALQGGVTGCLTKEAEPREVTEAVKACSAGRRVLPPVAEETSRAPALLGSLQQKLTPREHEVLGLMAEGLSIPQMARNLSIAPATLKTHAKHIYEKLGACNRGAAIAEAMRAGILS
jgi:two-component system nitrate/nitrite response regulator NarL